MVLILLLIMKAESRARQFKEASYLASPCGSATLLDTLSRYY